MQEVERRTLNSLYRKRAISSWYNPAFSSKRSRRASNIWGVIRRRRPTPFAGALVLPKHRGLEAIARIARSLQPATSAMSTCLSDLLSIMSRISLLRRCEMRCHGKNGRLFLPYGTQRCWPHPIRTLVTDKGLGAWNGIEGFGLN